MSKRKSGYGLDSGVGTFTHTVTGWSSESASKWINSWFEKHDLQRKPWKTRRVEKEVWDEIWHEMNKGFFCTMCGEVMEYDGRDWRSWSKTKICDRCKEAGRSAVDVCVKYCKYCRKEIHRQPFEDSAQGKKQSGWQSVMCCDGCKNHITTLKRICKKEVKKRIQRMISLL